MSSSRSSARPSFQFHVSVLQHNGAPSRSSEISVFDAWDVEVASGDGDIDQDLPRGLYTVRVTRAGQMSEEVVRHRGTTDLTIDEPKRASALPTFDTVGAHEYYSYTSAQWSTQDTRGAIGPSPDGRLFIFIRSVRRETYRDQQLADGLELVDEIGNFVSRFGPEEIEFDADGWLAFSAPATPGLYLLSYDGPESRTIPLYVFPDLSTQFFVVYGERLRLDTASILLHDKYQPFNPDDRQTQAIDSALKGLQEGRNLLPRGAMQMLLSMKFDDPMLGLLGAHILLLRDRDRDRDTDPGLLHTVIGNLEHLLPRSPDVDALKILAARRLGDPLPEVIVERPPMIRGGLEAVLAYSAERSDVVPEGSLLDRIATRQFADLPWTSWNPLADVAEDIALVTRSATPRKVESQISWVSNYIEDAMESAEQFGREVNLPSLAANIGLPQRTIERAAEQITRSRRSVTEEDRSGDLQQVAGIGPAVGGVLERMGYRTLNDLARVDEEEVDRIKRRLGRYAGRMDTEQWVEQAHTLLGKKDVF